MRNDSNQWLERLLARHIYHNPAKFDFQRWSEKHPEESRLLKGGFKDFGRSYENRAYYLLRCIMESKITKYSAAAVAALAIALVLLSPFGGQKHGGVLLAAVQEKIAETDTMVMRGHKIFSCVNEPNLSLKLDLVKYFSNAYGYTEEGYMCGKQVYRITINLPEKRTIIIMPILQKYIAFPATDEQIKLMEKMNPAGLIGLLLQSQYRELGSGDVNGTEVEGFELTFNDEMLLRGIMPKFLFALKGGKGVVWVGVKEFLPVKVEGDMVVGPCLLTFFTECRIHDLSILENYNIALGPEFFSTAAPEGYTEIKLTDFIPIKTGAGVVGASVGVITIGVVVRKKLRNHRAVRSADSK